MALPTPSTPANPTIGNAFSTEAVILNTLLTALKQNWTDLNTYLTTTGLENANIASKAIKSINLFLQSQKVNLANNEVTVNNYTIAGTEYNSSAHSGTITINNAFANAVNVFFWQINGRNDQTGKNADLYDIWMQRATDSGFTTGLTNILSGTLGDINQSVGEPDGTAGFTNFEFTNNFFFVDNGTKSASTNYYYRLQFKVRGQAGNVKIKNRASFAFCVSLNGIYT